jgi:hypothetical protein
MASIARSPLTSFSQAATLAGMPNDHVDTTNGLRTGPVDAINLEAFPAVKAAAPRAAVLINSRRVFMFLSVNLQVYEVNSLSWLNLITLQC